MLLCGVSRLAIKGYVTLGDIDTLQGLAGMNRDEREHHVDNRATSREAKISFFSKTAFFTTKNVVRFVLNVPLGWVHATCNTFGALGGLVGAHGTFPGISKGLGGKVNVFGRIKMTFCHLVRVSVNGCIIKFEQLSGFSLHSFNCRQSFAGARHGRHKKVWAICLAHYLVYHVRQEGCSTTCIHMLNSLIAIHENAQDGLGKPIEI